MVDAFAYPLGGHVSFPPQHKDQHPRYPGALLLIGKAKSTHTHTVTPKSHQRHQGRGLANTNFCGQSHNSPPCKEEYHCRSRLRGGLCSVNRFPSGCGTFRQLDTASQGILKPVHQRDMFHLVTGSYVSHQTHTYTPNRRCEEGPVRVF